MLVLSIVSCSVACDPKPETEQVPPLRPLAYTESPSYTPEHAREVEEALLSEFVKTGRIPVKSAPPVEEPAAALGEVESDILEPDVAPEVPAPGGDAPPTTAPAPKTEPGALDLSTPEGLAKSVYDAMVGQKQELFESLLVGEADLRALAGVKEATAKKRAEALRTAANKSYALFTPGSASEEPAGGLASMLELQEVEPGKPGTIWGKTPRKNEETVQYWGTNVLFKLKSEGAPPEEETDESQFKITLGRMLKTPGGDWKLASAPVLAGGFHTFLTAGFHLKPEILQPEHYPFPLSVGNFWRYRVRNPNSSDAPRPKGLATPIVEEVRVEVTHIEQGRGYRVVTLKRHHKAEETTTTTFYYLVTPRRMYTCTRYCNSRSKNLAFVLDYVRTRVPFLVLPARAGIAWGPGGELVTTTSKFRTAARLELTVVPVGEFSETIPIHGESRGLVETRHFKPGIGFVRREIDTSTGPRIEELLKYRILTAE